MKKLLLSLLVTLAICACAKKGATTSGQEDVTVTKIYNLVILDRSGSMFPLRESAVLGYNGLLDVVRSAHYYERIAQYNKDIKNMSKEERNEYLRTRNAQDNWFEQ